MEWWNDGQYVCKCLISTSQGCDWDYDMVGGGRGGGFFYQHSNQTQSLLTGRGENWWKRTVTPGFWITEIGWGWGPFSCQHSKQTQSLWTGRGENWQNCCPGFLDYKNRGWVGWPALLLPTQQADTKPADRERRELTELLPWVSGLQK